MNVELPSEISIDFRDEIGTQAVALEGKSVEWIIWAIGFGLRQSVGDAIAGKAGTTEGEKAIKAKFEKVCINGEIPRQGAGGGGASLEDRIASKFLALCGVKGKLDELEARWMEFAKATVLDSVEAAEAKALKADAMKLAGLAEEYLDQVKEAAEDDPRWTQAEAMVKKAPKATSPKLKIKIG